MNRYIQNSGVSCDLTYSEITRGEHLNITQFIEEIESGVICPSYGHAYFATSDKVTNKIVDINKLIQEDKTEGFDYVVWIPDY